jgi:hypothetical protein
VGRVKPRTGVVAAAAGAAVLLVAACGVAPDDSQGTVVPVRVASTTASETVPSNTEPKKDPRRWDPRDVDDLPDALDEVAPLLPAVIDPPSSARPLVEAPIEAAILTISRRRTVFVLSTDGSWRSIPVPEPHAWANLSRGGTRLLFTEQNDVEVWDLTTGDRRTIPFPEDLVPWDYTRAKWVDESTYLLDDYRGGWLVDLAGCSTRRVPYPTEFVWTVDDDGAVVERPGRLERLVATSRSIIGTTYGDGRFRVVVADRPGLEPRAVLPLRDFEGNYSNWALGPVAVLGDGAVLLWVAVVGKDDGWRLVAWDPDTDDLSLVSRSDAEPTDVLTYAVDLLR